MYRFRKLLGGTTVVHFFNSVPLKPSLESTGCFYRFFSMVCIFKPSFQNFLYPLLEDSPPCTSKMSWAISPIVSSNVPSAGTLQMWSSVQCWWKIRGNIGLQPAWLVSLNIYAPSSATVVWIHNSISHMLWVCLNSLSGSIVEIRTPGP